MRKIVVIGAIIGVVIVACSTLVQNSHSNVDHQEKWKSKAPELFNNAGYGKLIESANRINNVSESQANLMGTITNSFGIRDDVLESIIQNVPQDNEKLMRASIELMQLETKIYFDNTLTQAQALALDKKECLITACIAIYFNKDVPSFTKYLRGMDALFRNTKERDAHMWKIDRKFYSWKLLSSGLSVADEEIVCKKGEF